MQPQTLNLFFEPKDRLRLTVADEKSYITVKPCWAAPMTHPKQYLALLNGKAEEIATIPNPSDLSRESFEAVQIELARRYLTAEVLRIVHAKVEFGATYWTVETERGVRDFVTQSLQENAQWLTSTHLLLVDVDGNRFEIRDVSRLDDHSRHYVEAIV